MRASSSRPQRCSKTRASWAYAGQGPRLKTKALVAAALSIHSVEARHAAWVRDIMGGRGANRPAPVAFDKPKTRAQILAAVRGTGFIVG